MAKTSSTGSEKLRYPGNRKLQGKRCGCDGSVQGETKLEQKVCTQKKTELEQAKNEAVLEQKERTLKIKNTV